MTTVVGTFQAGATLGAGATILGLYVMSGFTDLVPATARATIIIAAALALVVHDVVGVHFLIPERRGLIPEAVALQPGLGGPFRFGFEMGTGVRTFLPTLAPHVLAVCVLLGTPSILSLTGVAIGLGAGRSLTLWIGSLVGSTRIRFELGTAEAVVVQRTAAGVTAIGALAIAASLI